MAKTIEIMATPSHLLTCKDTPRRRLGEENFMPTSIQEVSVKIICKE